MAIISSKSGASSSEAVAVSGTSFRGVLACVDGSRHAQSVLAHAATIAAAHNTPLAVLRVLQCTNDLVHPHDPVAWDICKREAEGQLKHLVAKLGKTADTSVEIIAGPTQERILSFIADHDIDLCVVGSSGEGGTPADMIGSTARRIVDYAPCSVLLVPPQSGDMELSEASYRKLLVPLDCSRRAESALTVAVSLGGASGAEIILAHAVPQVSITEVGPLEENDVELRDKIQRRNERVGKRYLSRMRAQLALSYKNLRTIYLRGGDVRHMLANAAVSESADVIVLSAKGASGHADQRLGSVAEYIITHIEKPVLVVRPTQDRKAEAGSGVAGGAHLSVTTAAHVA